MKVCVCDKWTCYLQHREREGGREGGREEREREGERDTHTKPSGGYYSSRSNDPCLPGRYIVCMGGFSRSNIAAVSRYST